LARAVEAPESKFGGAVLSDCTVYGCSTERRCRLSGSSFLGGVCCANVRAFVTRAPVVNRAGSVGRGCLVPHGGYVETTRPRSRSPVLVKCKIFLFLATRLDNCSPTIGEWM